MSNMVVNTNVLALNSHRAMKPIGSLQAKASARLSSGLKINSAADDAAGLAISEKMRAQIRGLDMASKNTQDGISLVQTADGALQEVVNMTQRVRELMVQSLNGTNQTEDQDKIDLEISALAVEVGDMATRITFNKIKVLDKTEIGKVDLQVGPDDKMYIQLSGAVDKLDLSALAGKFAATTGKVASTSTLVSDLDAELENVLTVRANLGAIQNRLEYTMKSLDISSENLSASESRIRDTDMAKEMMNLTKANVLQQAAVSMLAQANQAPQSILQLLR